MKKFIYPTWSLSLLCGYIIMLCIVSFSSKSHAQSHSSTIALNRNSTVLININRETNSVTIFKTLSSQSNDKALKK